MSGNWLKFLVEPKIGSIYDGSNLPYEVSNREIFALREKINRSNESFEERFNAISNGFNAISNDFINIILSEVKSEQRLNASGEIRENFSEPSAFLNDAYKYNLNDDTISGIMEKRQNYLKKHIDINTTEKNEYNEYLKQKLANEYFAAGKIDDAIKIYGELKNVNKNGFLFDFIESLNGICQERKNTNAVREKISTGEKEFFTEDLDHKIAMLCLKDRELFDFFLPRNLDTDPPNPNKLDDVNSEYVKKYSAQLKINMAVAARIVKKEPKRINDVLPNLYLFKGFFCEVKPDNKQLGDFSELCKAHLLINGKEKNFIDGFLDTNTSGTNKSIYKDYENELNETMKEPIEQYNKMVRFKEEILNSVSKDGNKRAETSKELNKLLEKSPYRSADGVIDLIKSNINDEKSELYKAINKVRHPTLLKIKDTVLRKKHNTKSLDKVLKLTKVRDTKSNEPPKVTTQVPHK